MEEEREKERGRRDGGGEREREREEGWRRMNKEFSSPARSFGPST